MKNRAELQWVLAPALAVLCYGTQAIVNINLPIATPLMWALLAVGLAAVRQEKAEKDEADAASGNGEKTVNAAQA